MTSNELVYVKETKIWVSHPEKVWECAILQENYIKGCKSLKISKGSGELSEIYLNREDDLPPLRNPAILIGQNDLTALSYLHEPAVLHNLEIRFRERQAIYTYCGIVLVAINPYAELPLYGSDIIRAYRGHSMGELEPHIFAVAEEAYAKLEREKCDQSVIVSGESGAGKTVSAKYVMRYFAAVGGSESETQIERRVLASSPIMEAIGNAKTIRNDNSSRFGKFTKLLFRNDLGTMILTGATMQTYLLEKSRVVFQAHSERNYHIFYQLCAGREKWPELILDDQSKFRYLNSGKSLKINNVCDLNQLNETLGALRTLGFTSQDVNEIMKVLAGILHLGNIEITYKHKKNSNENDSDGSDISLNDLHLNIVSEVLRINVEDLRKWLILRQIESVNEFVLIPQSPAASMTARDALSKHIYSKLFQYIVSVINLSLMCGKSQNCFIGVLDIYGFETFDTNSFEQFCINYANEKLQQQFNQHVFKLEQEEYLKEGIVWTMIDFYDNQPCIDLIESKLGILDLLDEECKVPKGTDESWASKIIDKCIKYKHFERPRFGSTSFFIKHFSDIVQYDVQGFLEKNRDTVSKELVNVIRQSEISLCRKLMELEETDIINDGLVAPARGRVVVSAAKTQIATSRQHKKTIGSQFRDSLSLLITTLHSTTPHYVRCIKPNEEKVAFKWEPSKIVQQLRACGVLETVRISAAGFPSRWLYSDFYNRYRLLCSKDEIIDNDIKQTCKRIVLKWSADDDKYRFGYTQIFFRAGQVAYLEQIRSNIRKKYIIIVQSVIRRFVYRSFYLHLQKSALGIQTYARGFLARRKAQDIRQNRAAITIQRYIRGWYCKIHYLKLKSAILGIQKYARGLLSRQLFNDLLKNYKATQIQRICRGYLARRAYKKKLESVIKSQAVIRAFLARRLYKRLKAEARTIVHIQKMYKGLENKIISLQQKIDEITKENHTLKIKVGDIPKLKLQIEAKKGLENELKYIKQEILEKDLTIQKITKQLEVLRDENMMMLDEKGRDHEEWKKQKRTWRMQNEELRKQFDEMIEMAKKKDSTIIHRTKLLSEVDSNDIYQAYQRALKDKEIIENENYLLKEELNRLRKVDEGTTEFNILSPSSQKDGDRGYSSTKNTEFKQNYNELTEPSVNKQTILILKLRKILEEEKLKNDALSKQLDIIKFRSTSTLAEDSIRASELEVENDKLRYDYQLLRNSIMRGVEHKELQAQHLALQEELGRRREECIQLRAVLAEQSQSLKQLGFGNNTGQDFNTWQENGALAEAFQAQKLVNRQLESELEALTKEHNTRLADLTTQLENERVERNQLQSMLQNKLEDSDEKDCDALRRNEKYLRYELEKSLVDYATSQEQINELNKKIAQLLKTSTNLASKLREHGVFDIHLNDDNSTSMISVKKKTSQKFQGIFKYQYEEVDKILQHLITDFTPRIAISLLPGLPAFVIFMCIRYTDLVNTEQHVKELLTKFVLLMKKIYRLPHTIEYRVLWLVNTLTLHNLLKQYGGFEEFISVNTFMQNQQQLKNFDLSEYRQVIYDNIMNLYQELIKQIQCLIKPQIVPAIIDHDETAQGKTSVTGRSMSLDLSPDHKLGHKPKSLISHFDQFYKQFQYFGLGDCYIEQIFKQLVYFICAVSMNSLMLRGKICMWKIGMQMRYNISCLENWMKKKKMSEEIISPIIPLNQVSLLLQSRKTEEDVQSIYELCTNLTTAQVLKLIKSHNVDDFENEISNTFIEKLTKKLNQRHPVLVSDSFTMNEDFIYPLKVVFTYSDIKLEDIELPAALNLDGLLSKI